MIRTARWQQWSGPGLGSVHVAATGSLIHAAGVAIAESAGKEVATTFAIVLDAGWRVISLALGDAGKPETARFSRSDRWSSSVPDINLEAFSACIDVDLSGTPFTNTLPIRRLNLAIGGHRDLAVMHFSTPEVRPRVARQRYTRLARWRYLYQDATFDFAAEFEVDDDGLVLDYPGLFRRVPD